MKNLIDTIKTNFDLYDFLSHKYENYKPNKGIELNSYFTEMAFDEKILYKYRDKINWDKISIDVPLTEELIDEFFEELYDTGVLTSNGLEKGCRFSLNTKINWTASLIEKFKNHLHWESILQNPSVPWDEFLIDKYLPTDNDRDWHWISLSSNPGIKWNEYLITKYHSYLYINCLIKYSKIFWETKLLNTTLGLIKIENQRLYLTYFSEITNIKWDFNTIIAFPNSYSYWLRNVIKNKTIELNFDILRKYINQIDNNLFTIIQVSDDLCWNSELIKEFSSHINYDILSESSNVNWSNQLISTFQEHLNFQKLSKNFSLTISYDLLKIYSERWDFKFLSKNRSVCWDLESMEEFIEQIELDEIITNPKIKFTSEFIEKFKNKFSWNGKWRKFGSDSERYDASEISRQRHLPISVKTLTEMTKKWGKGCTEHYGRIEDEREWYFFSENSNLTPEHLHNFKDLFSWEILSKNQALQISKEILSRYAEKWDYSEILKRDDIDWDIDVFCRISNYLNWDIIKANESKIMEILQLEENTILNYFSFVKTYRRPLHREVYGSFVQSREERDNKIIMNAEVCGKALEESNLLNMDDFNELWEWLKRYMNLYYDHSELSKRLIRFPSNTRASDPYINTEDKIRGFFFKYEIIKKRLDRLFEEK